MTVGIIEGFLLLLFSVVYIVTLVIALILPLVKRKSFNFYPLVSTAIVIVAVIISFNLDIFESPTALYARTKNRIGQSSLTLRHIGRFKIQQREIEWSCYYKGRYGIQGDTLLLLRNDIRTVTNDLFTDKYLIDANKKILIQINKFDLIQDTTKWLTIIDDAEM